MKEGIVKFNYDDRVEDAIDAVIGVLETLGISYEISGEPTVTLKYWYEDKVPNTDKPAETNMNKLKIEKSYIEAYKPLFDLYPDLTKFPVYAWGRYYKYECAGGEFEYSGEYGGWKKIAITCTKVNYLNDGKIKVEKHFNDNEIALIEIIDKKENVKGGKLYSGEMGDFLPDRSDVVKAYHFDDRAGNCLVVKKENDTFIIECVDCDSPE